MNKTFGENQSHLKSLQQKEEQINTVLSTIKANPKFIKLLFYSLNSLEGFVTPPNKEVRVNSKVIISLEGIEVLKLIGTVNTGNDEILMKIGEIYWKLISVNERLDYDCIKLFIEKQGDMYLNELICNKPGELAIYQFIKCINGLVQIPQIIPKLINRGVIESLRNVNDRYKSDTRIISKNLETLGKISNTPKGKEELLKNNVFTDIMINILQLSQKRMLSPVITGLSVIEQLLSIEDAKEASNHPNLYKDFISILENFDGDLRIEIPISKIVKKIVKKVDVEKIVSFLKINNDLSEYLFLEMALNKISVSCLVEDLNQICKRKENIDIFYSFFLKLNDNSNLNSDEEFKQLMFLAKSILFILNRIQINEGHQELLVASLSLWNKSQEFLISQENCIHFMKFFNEISNIIQMIPKTENSITDVLKNILEMIQKNLENLSKDSKFDYILSKILIGLLKIKNNEINEIILSFLDYVLKIIDSSDDEKTLENITQYLLCIVCNSSELTQRIWKSVTDLMKRKSDLIITNHNNLLILENYLSNEDKNELQYHQNSEISMSIMYVIMQILIKEEENSEEDSIKRDISNKNKIIGIKLLERLLDKELINNEVNKFVQIIKDFSPAALKDNDNDLERSLVFFSCAFQIKDYMWEASNEIVKNLTTLINKEINFIESQKKEKEVTQTVQYSNKRLGLEVGLLKMINKNITFLYSDQIIDQKKIEISTLMKDINNMILQILDKSSNSAILSKLAIHLKTNLKFLLENEQSYTPNDQEDVNKFNSNAFESGIIDKSLMALINLLRKNVNDEALSIEIIKTFLILSNAKSNICNILVKSGCIRHIFNIMENTAIIDNSLLCMNLIKIIINSSQENLEMLSKQSNFKLIKDLIEKLNETYIRHSNSSEIKILSNSIMNELMKLPNKEEENNDIIISNIEEICNIMKNSDIKVERENILKRLERINFFVSSPNQISLIINKGFIFNLFQLLNIHLNEEEDNNTELLLNNEFNLIKIVVESITENASSLINESFKYILKILNEKTDFRDLIFNSLHTLLYFLSTNSISEGIKEKIESSLIDKLYDILEKYFDDLELEKVIKNILRILCLRSEDLSKQIIKRGGLVNLIEQLEYLIKFKDQNSLNLKQNGLKFINSLCKEKNFLQNFVDLKGREFLENMLNNDLVTENKLYTLTHFSVYDCYNLNKFHKKEDEQNHIILETLSIINKLVKRNYDFNDYNLISNKIIEAIKYIKLKRRQGYSNKEIYEKGIKILSNLKSKGKIKDLDHNKVRQVILSFISNNYYNKDFFEKQKKTFLDFSENDNNDINEFIQSLVKDQNTINSVLATPKDISKIFCYLGLYADIYTHNCFNSSPENSLFIDYVFNQLNQSNNEAEILSIVKILNSFSKNDLLKNYILSGYPDFASRIMSQSTKYLKNPYFLNFLIEEKIKLLNSLGCEDITEKNKNKFYEEIYPNLIEFFENHLIAVANHEDPSNYSKNLINNSKDIIIDLISNNNPKITSSIKNLAKLCETIINSRKIGDDNIGHFFEILYHIHLNLSKRNENLCDNIISSIINYTETSNPNDIKSKQSLLLISANSSIDMEKTQKIIEIINRNLVKQLKLEHINEQNIGLDLKILSNLTNSHYIARILSNNSQFFDNLASLKKLENSEIKRNIIELENNITKSKPLVELLIDINPKYLQNIFNDSVQTNDLQMLENLFHQSIRKLLDASIVNQTDLHLISEKFTQDEIISKKIKEVLDCEMIDDFSEFDDDIKSVNLLFNEVEDVFEKSKNETINSNSIKKKAAFYEKKSSFLNNKLKLSKTSSNISADSNFLQLERTKSILSVMDNPELNNNLDQMFSLIDKFLEEIKQESCEDKTTNKVNLISKLLEAMKLISLNNDNHQFILSGILKVLKSVQSFEGKSTLDKIAIDCLDIIKSCTENDSVVSTFNNFTISNKIINEVANFYENTDLITEENKDRFIQENAIFANLCKSPEGFSYLFENIGMDRMLTIAKNTCDVNILAAIMEALIGYLQTQNDFSDIIGDILTIIAKCFTLNNRNTKLMSNCNLLAGLAYSAEISEYFDQLDFVKNTSIDMDNFMDSSDYIYSLVFCVGKITINNEKNLNSILEHNILNNINNSLDKVLYDESLIQSVTTLYANLLINNLESLQALISLNLHDCIIRILEIYNPKDNNQMILNCILCINQIVSTDEGIEKVSDTRFQEVFFETIERQNNDSEIIRFSTLLLGNYLCKEAGNNIKRMNFNKLIQILNSLQKNYYYNSDVLTNINIVAGNVIRFITEKHLKEKCVFTINESVKIQDWNVNLIHMSFTLFMEILEQNSTIIDNVFEEILLSCLNVLTNHKDSEILILSCSILLIFSKNYIYTYVMVNKSLVEIIKFTMDRLDDIKKSDIIRDLLFKIIGLLIPEFHNALKVSDELMNNLINYSNTAEFANSQKDILRLLYMITKHKSCIEPFVQYRGVETIIDIILVHEDSGVLSECINILNNVVEGNEEYKLIMNNKKIENILNKKIETNKSIEEISKNLIRNICSLKIDSSPNKKIKPEIINYLITGKLVKVCDINGDVKSLLLTISSDLKFISCRPNKKDSQAKQKYVMEKSEIQEIIRGHGTVAFENSKGVYRGVPKPEKCFTIMGRAVGDNQKSLNIECDSAEEAQKLINYLELILNKEKK